MRYIHCTRRAVTRAAGSICFVAAVLASSAAMAGPAYAAPADPCNPGRTLVGLFCLPDPAAVPDPTAAPPAQAAPAPATPPHRSLLDRVLGRNLPPAPAPAPAAPAPAPAAPWTPAAPAPAPPPDSLGGNVLGPIEVIPGGGTCSPGAVIAVLADVYTCPPGGVLVVPASTPGQPPTAGQALVPQLALPVTH